MKTLDLHNTNRDSIEFIVEKFITDNFDNLPIKVITGNSDYNVGKVGELAKRYCLNTHKERWVNNGAWIVG